jgi:pyocin large subunit-like protein
MADNGYNTIKPVQSLQNIGNITAAKRREERKKRQNSREKKKRQEKLAENELNESTEQDSYGKIAENGRDENSIDYRA